jgi:osmotically-inducible protein OsmY
MDICAQVENAIHWVVAIPRHSVMVEADGGLVTLHGVVDRAYEKSCAEAIARRVPGVINVGNKISVRAAADFIQPPLRS